MDKRDECHKTEEQMHENQEKHEKKPAADEVKEKNKIHNAKCNDSVMLSTEKGGMNY